MVSMDMNKVPLALADFLDQRVLTALDSNSPHRWIIGGVSTIALTRFDSLIKTYMPILKGFGLVDETGCLVVDVVETFIRSAFDKQPNVRFPIMGIPFNFNREDGEAFLQILRQRGGL